MTLDEPQNLINAPVGLQMVGRKLEEETVLELVRVAVEALHLAKA